MDSNKFGIGIEGYLEKTKTEKRLKSDVKTLKEINIPLVGKLLKTRTNEQLKKDIQSVTATVNLTAKASKKGLTSSVKDIVKQAQDIANKNNIKLNVGIDDKKLDDIIAKLKQLTQSSVIDTTESVEAINREAQAMLEIIDNARKATLEKLEFAEANREVRESAEHTADAINRERNAMESMDNINYILANVNMNAEQGDSVFRRFGNTLNEAFATYTIANLLEDAIYEIIDAGREGIEVVKELNDVATSLRMATGGSLEETNALVDSYNDLGQELGAITSDVSESADAWLRQGHSIADTNTLITDSMMLSKIANLQSAESTEYLTSIMQAYKLSASEVVDIVSKLSAVDLESASDAGGLAKAMSRCASAAEMAGVSMDTLIGYISSVKEVTQDSDEAVGNMFKSVFSRMNQIRAGKFVDLETGESLNDTEKVLNKIGIVTRDVNNQLIDSEQILDSIGKSWHEYDNNTQKALATAVAGTYQYNKFIALMQSYGDAMNYANISANSQGVAEEKFSYYLDSLEAKTNSLKASLENLATTTLSDELYASVLDTSKAVVDLIADTGVLKGLLIGLGTSASIYGFQQITNSLGDITQGFANLNEAMNMTRGGTVGINDMQRLIDLTGGLSQSQTRLLLSTNNLTDAQKIAILMNQGLTQAEAQQTIQTWGVATAQNGATVATITFTGALRGLWATLMANPLILVTTLISAGVMAYDAYNKKLEEASQKFDDLKTEVSEIESELSSLNTELQTTVKRMNELESKDTLTFTEKEEYDNLVKQNNELQRRIDLLELEQQVKNKEKNKAFVDTMNGDTTNRNEYWTDESTGRIHEGNSFWASLGGILATDSNEEEYINQQFEDRARLLEEKYNAETKEEQDRIQKQVDDIESYLQSKSSQWTNDASGIDYISNPTTEDDKAVNAWLDYIADFQDHMAIAMGGTNAKENAFNRLVDNWQFDDTVQGLQDLGEQGKVTADMLNDPEYQEFINKLVELGIIDSSSNLEDIALAFNKVNESAGQAEEEVTKFFGAFDGSEIGERLQYITQKFNDGELSYREYFEGLQSEINNVDFTNYTDSLEEANSATQQFFVDSMQQTATSLSDLFSEFDSGKISITEYLESYVAIGETLSALTDELQENSATWNENGEAIDSATSIALDNTQNKLASAIDVIASYQDSIYSLEQIMTQTVEAGSDEFSAHCQVIAQDLYNIVQSGGLMAEEIKNVLGTTTEEIAQSLTQNVSNQSIAAQAISANTNTAITDMATSVGELFDTLGDAISNFKVDITFGVKSITMKEADLGILGNVKLPAVEFGIEASGESLDAIGSAISAFGKSVKSNFVPQTIELEDYFFGSTENAKNYSYTPDSSILNNYNSALDGIKEKAEEAKKASEKETKETAETFNWIEVAIERVKRTISNLGDIVSYTYKKWSTRNNALAQEIYAVNDEIRLQQRAYEKYMSLANSVSLSSHYKNLVQNGAIHIDSIKSDFLKEQIKQYQEFYNQALECEDAVAKLKDELVNLAETKFEHLITEYDNQLAMIEQKADMIHALMDNVENKGYMLSAVYYDALLDTEQKTLSELQEKHDRLNNTLNEMVSNGTIEEYSEKWCEMQLEIDGVKEAILESEGAVIEFNNALRDLDWDVFDKMQNSMSKIPTESDFLIDLMSDEEMHDDKGQLTEHGQATLGLHAVNYNAYMVQADEYAKELLELNKEIADDPNNQTLLERREELLESQRDMIKSAEDELQSIKDLYSNGYDKLLDSMSKIMDKRKSMFSQMKDMYDYQKSIEEQTKEVSDLEKQLLAYKGDTSESAMSIVQELKVKLEEAKDNLAETEWEQQIKEEEKLLNALYDRTEEWINTRLDDLNGIVQSAIDSTNANAESIKTTLEVETDEVGMKLSDEMSKILTSNDGMKAVVTMYGDNFSTKITTVNSTLLDIKAVIEGMAKASDTTASKDVSSSVNTSNSSSVPTVTTPTVTTSVNNVSSSSGGVSGWESALVYSEYKGSNSKLNTSTSIVDLLKSHDYSAEFKDRANLYKAMGGSGIYTGSSKQNRFMIDTMKAKGYKKGSSNIPFNQMNWVHDGEMILKRESDGGYLTSLTAGSQVFTAEQVENMRKWASLNPVTYMPSMSIPSMPAIQNLQSNALPNINIEFGDTNVALPNVRTPEDFADNFKEIYGHNIGRVRSMLQNDILGFKSPLEYTKYGIPHNSFKRK